MRILHFSDFHLNGSRVPDGEHNLKYMLLALDKIKKEKPIDLVVFSGDMLERGGEGYNKDLKAGFADFRSKVIEPIMSKLELSLSRFIFTPGNHDIDFEADDELTEDGIEKLMQDYEGIVTFAKRQNIWKYTARVDAFKTFESNFYKELDDVVYNGSRFVSTLEYEIEGNSVGVSMLNDVWRCGLNDKDKIVLGLHQIAENATHLEGKSLRLAIMHYPIEFLKETERHRVMELCAQNFDVVFCGHSHSGYVNFQVPLHDNAFLEVNASGTLAANTYTKENHYQNSFQIVDCEAGIRYSVRKYYQKDFQNYVLELNERYPDGNNVRYYPNSEQLESYYKKHIEEQKKAEEQRFRHAIAPFVTLKEFVNRPNNIVMKSEFVRGKRISQVMNEIGSSTKDYRFMALSGMGKTRIIAEIFRDKPNVYYSYTGDCIGGLHELLRFKNTAVVIVDNCNSNSLREVQKRIDESGKEIRLITIHNVLIPSEQRTRGELKILDYSDTSEVVDTMIANEVSIQGKEYVINAIKERSGNIPYMTVLLLDAYRKNNSLSIDNADDVLSAILSGSEPLEENKSKVLKALSLFDPLGYENNIKEEYDFILQNNKIHHIALNQDAVQRIFIDTINDYYNRQLLEIDGNCLRLRPRPLAEWLTETWLIEYGGDIPDIIDEISHLEEELSRRLFRAINNRIKEMQTSPSAKKVFDIINNPETGSFHNERIAFSKAGSQLFLSMGLVSPVMVAKNLCKLIENKSIEWLRDELDSDARRNLVWALENICMNADAFVDGGKCLARLAVAENEGISNNATGQFLQLFHLYLSGTLADLKKRITLIQSLREDDAYLPLLIRAIGSAFVSRSFFRSNTSGAPSYSDTPDDYQPTIKEVKIYWRDCADVLTYITGQKPELVPMAIEILPKHVGDFANLREMSLLYKLIEHYAKYANYQWPEMRDALSMCLQYWFKGTEEQEAELRGWLVKLAPKSLLGRIKASLKDENYKINNDFKAYEENMSKQMEPFADEFIKDELYYSHDFEDILLDKELQSYWFIKCVSQKINEHGLAGDVLSGALSAILNQPETFDCRFVPTMVGLINDSDAVDKFKSELFSNKRYNLYSSIVGVVDNESYSLLQDLLMGYKNGVFDNHCVNNYLRYYRYHTMDNILRIFDLMKNNGVSDKDVCYSYVLNHLQYHMNKAEERALNRYKEVLLSFDFDDSYPDLSTRIVDAMCSVLSSSDAHDFAKGVHKKAVEYLRKEHVSSHPFERLYFDLLPKYQDDILEDLCEILSSEDKNMLFYYNMYNILGSGFNSGAGPLFQCNNETLKAACLKHPSILPRRFAQMCPVYKYTDDGKKESFSEFFLWLCDNFGNQKDMLSAFGSNMGTFSWSGINGFSNYIAERIPCITTLLSHPNPTVKEWAKMELESVQNEVVREQGKEAYERMIRG